jgi:hypothetical protein
MHDGVKTILDFLLQSYELRYCGYGCQFPCHIPVSSRITAKPNPVSGRIPDIKKGLIIRPAGYPMHP